MNATATKYDVVRDTISIYYHPGTVNDRAGLWPRMRAIFSPKVSDAELRQALDDVCGLLKGRQTRIVLHHKAWCNVYNPDQFKTWREWCSGKPGHQVMLRKYRGGKAAY